MYLLEVTEFSSSQSKEEMISEVSYLRERSPCTEGSFSPCPFYAVSELHSKLAHDRKYMSVVSIRPFLIVSLIVASGKCSKKCSLKSSQNELCWSTLVQESLLFCCL